MFTKKYERKLGGNQTQGIMNNQKEEEEKSTDGTMRS